MSVSHRVVTLGISTRNRPHQDHKGWSVWSAR